MTTNLTVKRFRTRRPDLATAAPQPAPHQPAAPSAAAAKAVPLTAARPTMPPAHQNQNQPTIDDKAFYPGENEDGFGVGRFDTAGGPMPTPGSPDAAPSEIDAIRREGLTGRQLRMARRLAQKHELPATSDFDAVRLLRVKGIDPFQTNSVLELVGGGNDGNDGGSRALAVTPGGDGIQLPQTIKPVQLPSTELRAEQAHLAEVSKIQRDIARRRRRKSLLLFARLGVFVFLPTFLAGLYFYTIATPMYAAKSEFVIQQSEAPSAGGIGGLFSSTPMATAQDSIAVQG